MPDRLQRKIWLIFVVVNLILLCGFSFSNSFFVSRYTMATALTLLIFSPFTIDRIITAIQTSQLPKKLSLSLLLLLLTLVSAEGLDVRTNKHYVKDAGAWVKQNIKDNARIYSNDKIAMYYARPNNADINLKHLYTSSIMKQFLDTGEYHIYDYFILVGEDKYLEDLMRQNMWYRFGRPVKMFNGSGKRFAFVYNLKKLDPSKQ